jgi:hypothetical protein
MVAWHYENSGYFSVRSAYRLGMQIEHDLGSSSSSAAPDGDRVVWKQLWKLPIPPKVRVFAWRLALEGLATNEKRKYRHVARSARCEICDFHNEDCLHALLLCPHAAALHHALGKVWNLPKWEEIRETGPEWLLGLMGRHDDMTMARFLMVIWRIWSVRNGVTQAGEEISIDGSVIFLTSYWDSLQQIKQDVSLVNQYGKQQVTTLGLATKKTKRIELSWTRPPEGVLKVNFDGAYNYRTQKAALGVIIRNNMGEPVPTAWRALFGCRDAEEAETWACLDGIRLAGRWSDMSLILESDCSLLVEKINKKAMDRSVTAGLIQEIKQELSEIS